MKLNLLKKYPSDLIRWKWSFTFIKEEFFPDQVFFGHQLSTHQDVAAKNFHLLTDDMQTLVQKQLKYGDKKKPFGVDIMATASQSNLSVNYLMFPAAWADLFVSTSSF